MRLTHETLTSRAMPGPRRRPYRRRGNALMMAVTLTTLLAIIGSAFVLVTRIDRKSARASKQVQGLEVVQARVLEDICRALVDDLHDVAGNTPLNHLATEPFDAPAYDKSSKKGDLWLAPIEPTYDSTSGKYGWWQVSDIYYPGVEAGAIAQPTSLEVSAMPAGAAIVLNGVPGRDDNKDGIDDGLERFADADGDGIIDSIWREPYWQQRLNRQELLPDKYVYVAVRIIDNCGMLNVNTGVDTVSSALVETQPGKFGLNEANYGRFPTQLDLPLLFARAQGVKPDGAPTHELSPTSAAMAFWPLDLLAMRLGGSYALHGGAVGRKDYPQYIAPLTAWYATSVLPFYEAPGVPTLNGTTPETIPSDIGQYARLFDISDEFELRNRFIVDSPFVSRLEQRTSEYHLLGSVLSRNYYGENGTTVTAAFRPASSSKADMDTATNAWLDVVMGPDRQGIVANAATWPDIRHLLTTYSFDRTMRLEATKRNALGPFRAVSVNRAVRVLLDPNRTESDPLHRITAKKLVDALLYAYGGTATQEEKDKAVQYVANLRDYLDDDEALGAAAPVLTHYAPNAFGSGMPSHDVYGFERQPFITEVYNVVYFNDTGDPSTAAWESQGAAIELYNPYARPISLAGWSIDYNGSDVVTFGAADAVPEYGRLVVVTDDTVLADIRFGTPDATQRVRKEAGFKIDPTKDGAVLRLLRPVAPTDASPTVVADIVVDKDMDELRHYEETDPPKTYYNDIRRGVIGWKWARATWEKTQSEAAPTTYFSAPTNWPWWPDGKGVGTDVTGTGIAIPVADQVSLAVPATAQAPLGLPVVRGWFELGRPLLIGNRNKDDTEEFPTVTTQIEDKVNNREDERDVRLNFAESGGDFGRKLFEALALDARCDDFVDNDNEDGNTYAHLGVDDPTAVDTGTDELMECRIPGRVNVNTAPLTVLQALVPWMIDHGSVTAYDPTTPTANDVLLTPEEFVQISRAFAAAVVFLRNEDGPYTDVADFWRRISERNTGELWFGRLVDALKGRAAGETITGDLNLNDDYEDRDWLLGRLAQVITTRSDTFTAYVLIRVQNRAAPEDYTERRIVAIIDRSNVFLPPKLAAESDTKNDSGDTLPVPAGGGNPTDINMRDRLYVWPRIVAVKAVDGTD